MNTKFSRVNPIQSFSILLLLLCQISIIHAQNCEFLSFQVTEVNCDLPLDTLVVTLEIEKQATAPTTGDIVLTTPTTTFTTSVDELTNPQTITFKITDIDIAGLFEANFSENAGCKVDISSIFENPLGCSSISGLVWGDESNDGLNNGGELPLVGLKVVLAGCSGNRLDSIVTDAAGAYEFPFYQPGNYQIIVEQPADGNYYEYAKQVGALTDTNNSDVDQTGLTDCFTLSNDGPDIQRDAGIVSCPPLSGLSCNGSLNVTLDPNTCTFKVTPQLLLSTTPLCLSRFEVRLFDDSGFIGDELTPDQAGKQVNAFVIDLLSETVCESIINVDDKTEPVIDCTPEIDYLTKNQSFQGDGWNH